MILTVGINAACECGFRMSDTGQYFTHIIYTNFSRLASTKTLASNPEFKRNWAIQKWNMPAVNWATPLPIHNQEQNVYLENGNMVLRQVGYPKEGILVGRNVSIASVAGLSNDVLHGSFRTEMKIEGANGGSVGAFFWYHVGIAIPTHTQYMAMLTMMQSG